MDDLATRLDLEGAFFQHVLTGEERDDNDLLHASSLISCDYATKLRLNGIPELPFDEEARSRFATGHAIEAYVASYLPAWAQARGLTCEWKLRIEYRGIIGNLDFLLRDAKTATPVAVIDVTTGMGPPNPKKAHVIKTAFYALAYNAPEFCEYPFQIGFGGKIVDRAAHWFDTADYVHEVDEAIERLLLVQRTAGMPPQEPDARLEYNKCQMLAKGKIVPGKSYCQAACTRNAAYKPNGPAVLA